MHFIKHNEQSYTQRALHFLICKLLERESYINFVKEKFLTNFHRKGTLTV